MRKPTALGKAVTKKGKTLRKSPGKAAVRHRRVEKSNRRDVQAMVVREPTTVWPTSATNIGTEVLLSVIAGKSPFSTINELNPVQRSEIVESGVPAHLLPRLASTLQVSLEKLYATVGVSRATVGRALKSGSKLNSADSEHVMGLARLVGQVEQVVKESGNPEGFDAGRWVANFLEAEHASLGGRRPGKLMRTSDGRHVVTTLVAQMQSGAYG